VDILTEPDPADPGSTAPGWDRPLNGMITLALERVDGTLP
jgi:hypothetical protein